MRPPTATRAGTRDSSTVRQDCSFLSLSSWRLRRPLGALDPCGASLFNIVLPLVQSTHTHTHTHTHFWEPSPQEARENTKLALMGHRSAEDDENPLEKFVRKLHGMFLAVLRARMEEEDEAGLLFLVSGANRRRIAIHGTSCSPPPRRTSPLSGPCLEIGNGGRISCSHAERAR